MGRLFAFLIVSLTLTSAVLAQTRTDKLYTVSGIGTSMPIGDASDVFGPKISTTLGLNLGLGEGGLFLYPKVSLHAFSYGAQTPDEGFTYTTQNGRATTYLLNVALGYRKMVGKFAFYGFAGAGGGYILTPKSDVNQATLQVHMSNESHLLPIAEGGAGVEYSLGGLSIFTEASYMNGFKKIQNRNLTTVPLTFGIKPNLSKLFNK
ncbi:autotransporter outer membrane beta-barrel domain-containing protein [Pedobacter xixiisoli]|uniref:Outer membrane autotransporter barrel domain-containing protein n=1 Tax=Pedobacter xixiisoli TaxID=1476464 RepID=A0A285ZXF1_9SPHI|nr:autotransporter outer membrane beta-barrel domain-containing protein [Pedobacter xixiisoli]SOD14300.1 outer membrane autotransporter barrel domain-containing protein [Pedobacter xixiisoli]